MEIRKLKYPTSKTGAPIQLYGYDTSASAWFALNCDPSGHLQVKHAIEFEITGSPINIRTYTASATTTLITATASQQLKLYKAFFSCESTINGTVTLNLGSKEIGAIINPISGGNHILMSASPDYEIGSVGASLSISTIAGTNTRVTVHWE